MSYLIAIIGYIIFLVILLISLHFFKIKRHILHMTIYSLIIYFLSLEYVEYLSIQLHFWSFTACFWFLLMLHYFLFFGFLKSVSVRVLCDLYNSPSNELNFKRLLNEYLKEESFKKRIDILLEKEMITDIKGEYSLTKKSKFIISKFIIVQNLFMVKESG